MKVTAMNKVERTLQNMLNYWERFHLSVASNIVQNVGLRINTKIRMQNGAYDSNVEIRVTIEICVLCSFCIRRPKHSTTDCHSQLLT
jgi:hypothetical protein